ncbi:MAG: fibronectin type III domain-containing protein [Polyangiaceae bacterium]
MDESDDEDNFVIERKPADGAFAEVITLPFDSTSHHDEGGLTAGEAYTYRVGAENANGISYSAEVTATAP